MPDGFYLVTLLGGFLPALRQVQTGGKGVESDRFTEILELFEVPK